MDPEQPYEANAVQVPSIHQLRAALRAAEVHQLDTGLEAPLVEVAYARLATDGLYPVEDLWIGDAILRGAGLLCARGELTVLGAEFADLLALPEKEACDELLTRYLAEQQPLWLVAAAAGDRIAWELIPDDNARTMSQLAPDIERREALLLAAARRADPKRDKRTGDLAEEQAVTECREELNGHGETKLAERVRRVSLTSDQLGYDVVAPRLDGTSRRLEVKGTRAQGTAFSVTVSRGEARQASRDADWYLVLCRVAADDSVSVVGWCIYAEIEPYLPRDADERGKWRTVEIVLDESILQPGLPPC